MKNLEEETVKLLKEEYEKIEEMALNRSDIIRELREAGRPIIYNLIQIYYWQNSNNNLNHWKEELYSALFEIERFKGTNKYPTYKQLKNWYLDTQLENIHDKLETYIDIVEHKEQNKIDENINKVNLERFISEYFIWLYKELSKTGQVKIDQVSEKIDELIKIYK